MVELNSMFHLRRVFFKGFVKEKGGLALGMPINDGAEPSKDPTVLGRSTMILLDKQTKIGRNPELVDVVLHSVVHSNMISRDHSEVVGMADKEGRFTSYFISDRSLNGTYVNDTRVKENVQLKEGDLIKFGHVNGAAIKAGEYAPQQHAEFIFRFERAVCQFSYFGFSQKGIRVPSEPRRAYMQVNSDRVLPTEVYPSASVAVLPKPVLPPATATAPNCASGAPGGGTVSGMGATAVQLAGSAGPANSTQPIVAAVTSSGQLAQLAATVSASAVVPGSTLPASQQQQNALNSALGQLGLGTLADEHQAVAAVNAHLRSIMASHDAIAINSAMERLAAQQQWHKSLLNLSALQQQNPLVYGHAFPAAAAAAAALFSGIGGIAELNSANPAATQYAAAASLWPNIRAGLPPPSQDWTAAQQQKAQQLAHQLQLRLPGSGLYQQPALSTTAPPSASQSKAGGLSSAFSLPGGQPVSAPGSAGLLMAAACPPSTSAAYSSCTSSAPVGIRPDNPPLSRGNSASSLPVSCSSVCAKSDSPSVALGSAQMTVVAQQHQQMGVKEATTPAAVTVSCHVSSGGGTKVSPVDSRPPPASSGGNASLQIASALAAAVAFQQQQHGVNSAPPPLWPSATPQAAPPPPPMGTPPVQQPLAQRLFHHSASSASSANSSLVSKSSSGVSSGATSASGNALLQSPGPSGGGSVQPKGPAALRDSLSSACPSSLNSSGASSAFSTPATSTNLSTLTAAIFAEEAVKKQKHTDKTAGEPTFGLQEGQRRGGREQQQDRAVLNVIRRNAVGTSGIEKEPKQEGSRQMMECDSSVPSPPSKVDEAVTANSLGTVVDKEEEDEGERKGEVSSRRRQSSASSTREKPAPARKDANKEKLKPLKQSRKSNEVARLLNDLTAGNCSWQYMAERNQQKAALVARQEGKNVKNNKKGGLEKRERKKPPLRLDERKQKEIEKKRAHKMMRQISDESSDEEHQNRKSHVEKGATIAAEQQRRNNGNGPSGQRKMTQHGRKHDSSNSTSSNSDLDGSSNSSGPDHSGDSEDDQGRKGSLVYNVGTADRDGMKRKLLSSAPKKTNNTLGGHNQAKPNSGTQKRGLNSADNIKKLSLSRKDSLSNAATGLSRKRKAGRIAGRDRRSEDEDDASNSDTGEKERSDTGRGKAAVNGTTAERNSKARRGRKSAKLRSADDNSGAEDVGGSLAVEDWTGGTGDPELCAHKYCKRPVHASINWVQCDDCDQWFHTACVFGTNTVPKDDEDFHCGCHSQNTGQAKGADANGAVGMPI